MTSALSYASIAIVHFQDSGGISIESISIDGFRPMLSGAWHIESAEHETFNNILNGSLILTIGSPSLRPSKGSRVIELAAFIDEAKNLNSQCEEIFRARKASDKKYKALKPPEFSEWNFSSDLSKSVEIMATLNLTSGYAATDPEMKIVLAAAKYCLFLLNNWFHDQVIRKEKPYFNLEISNQILPNVWLDELKAIRNG